MSIRYGIAVFDGTHFVSEGKRTLELYEPATSYTSPLMHNSNPPYG